MALAPLPIDEAVPRLLETLRSAPTVLLRAPAGAGKTTRVPSALLAGGLAGSRTVIVLEPRRIAARAAARRVALELGEELGRTVGYHVRFDRRAGKQTRILFVTEGIFLRLLQEDPMLEAAGCVVFDEFHERNLDGDLGLALARLVQRDVRPDLKLLVMSATLDTGALSAALGDCPVVESSGRLHPVAIEYAPRRSDDPLPNAVAAAVRHAWPRTSGDALVFLPGVGEIRRCRQALEDDARRQPFDLLELYGDLPPEQQDEVLKPRSRRKVILATNLAETSITVEGVTLVIDSGLQRRMRFDPATALDRLELGKISRASAEQRAGRAGRTAPGCCIRLWSELDHRALAERETPEIARVDLAGAALALLAWGERDLLHFPWIETPPTDALARALELLELLGATESGALSSLGKHISSIPAHPRIGRLLLEAQRFGALEAGCLAAALLSERDAWVRDGGRRKATHESGSDLWDRIQVLREFEARGSTRSELGTLHAGGASAVLRVAEQLERAAREAAAAPAAAAFAEEEAVGRALLAAFPDRLARRRERGSARARMAGGRGLVLADESAVTRAELFVALDVEAAEPDSRVRIASAVERTWIPTDRWITKRELRFDDATERVVESRSLEAFGLPIDRIEGPAEDAAAAQPLLLSAAQKRPQRAIPADDPAISGFLARLNSLRHWLPESGLPELRLTDLLESMCMGRRSFAELHEAPWLDALRGALTGAQLRLLEQEAPAALTVPSGSTIRLLYDPPHPPVLAVKIQELFGLAETPRVARGRIAVKLHLLAPNDRPQQITQDLASFWRNGYPVVRKELRARYPRHAWPEDPLAALPQRRPKPRGSHA